MALSKVKKGMMDSVDCSKLTGDLPAIDGSALTALTSANLTGTIADARFPATLPAISGANLTGVESVTKSATAPGSPSNGDLWYNTAASTVSTIKSKTIAVWNGNTWRAMSTPEFSATSTNSTITTVGLYTVHTFLANGTMTFVTDGEAEVFVVAGGGGGGNDMGGGGGAGGLTTVESTSYAADTYTILVGAGGAGSPEGTPSHSSDGIASSALGTSTVGGGGGGGSTNATYSHGHVGGSGGGGGGYTQGNSGAATSGQGNAGGAFNGDYYSGGGGGAGAVGATGTRGHGGIGLQNDWLGTTYYFAGGGGGSGYSTYGGNGGNGGGGAGAIGNPQNTGGTGLNAGGLAESGGINVSGLYGGAAGANTGGGGGGGSYHNASNAGGNGGSGIVIVRFLTGQ